MNKDETKTDLDRSIEKVTANVGASSSTSSSGSAPASPRAHGGSPKPRSFGKRSFGRRDTPTVRGTARKVEDIIPPLEGSDVRIIPLGGVEEIGRNMTMIEYKGDIIVVDIGFQFKDEDTPGFSIEVESIVRSKTFISLNLLYCSTSSSVGTPFMLSTLTSSINTMFP